MYLPNGHETDDAARYERDWREVSARLCRLLGPGWTPFFLPDEEGCVSLTSFRGERVRFSGQVLDRLLGVAALLEDRPHTPYPNLPDCGMAHAMACRRHRGQMWGPVPYVEHLKAVFELVWHRTVTYKRGYDTSVACAAWLHDIVEDTSTTLAEVRFLFGDRVADLVELVTNKPGHNRAARHEATYPAIRKDPDAIVLKLCDRIVNFRGPPGGGERNLSMQKMYRKEHPRFREFLHRGEECSQEERALWDLLEAEVARV